MVGVNFIKKIGENRMKMKYIVGIVCATVLLVGCGQKEKAKLSKEEVQSSSTVEKVENDSSINVEDLEQNLTEFIGLNTFYDNMIGNISYNFSDKMSEDQRVSLNELITDVFVPTREKLTTMKAQAKEKLVASDIDKEQLDKYLAMDQELSVIYEKWANQIVSVVQEPEKAQAVKNEINEETPSYVDKNQQQAMEMLKLLQKSGLSDTEARELYQRVLLTAMKEFGDPADISVAENQQ